jgi:hypothetical protein
METLFGALRRVVHEGSRLAGALAHSCLALQILFGDHEAALHHGRLGVKHCDPKSEHRLRVLLRLLLVLQYQGKFYGAEAQGIVAEARALAKTSGDLLLRFSLESNIAVAHLDSGNLDAAEVAMGRSTAMLGNAQLDANRFNQAINGGELALAQGEVELAQKLFLKARSFLGAKTPGYSESMVLAGLGLCAVETGNLSTAKALERSLPDDPGWWYFDPTLVVTFRCRMHQMRGERDRATALLTSVTNALEGRLVLAWLKLTLLHAWTERANDRDRAWRLASSGLAISQSLGLVDRARGFAELLRRLKR